MKSWITQERIMYLIFLILFINVNSFSTVDIVVEGKDASTEAEMIKTSAIMPALGNIYGSSSEVVEDTEIIEKAVRTPAYKTTYTRPALEDDWSKAQMEYISRYFKTAIEEMKHYNIPASITLSQGVLESEYGTSKLAHKSNNHFGIKCFSRTCKKGHCTNYTDDSHKDFFVNYKSSWYSYRAHSKFLQKDRYRKCFECDMDYKCWARALKKAGYATDPKYAEKLIGLIEKLNLSQFDKTRSND